MTEIDEKVALELQDYLKDSLGTDRVFVRVASNGAQMRFPARMSLKAGAAISAFFLNTPGFSPVTSVVLDSLVEAQKLSDEFQLEDIFMVIDKELQSGDLTGRKTTTDWSLIKEERKE